MFRRAVSIGLSPQRLRIVPSCLSSCRWLCSFKPPPLSSHGVPTASGGLLETASCTSGDPQDAALGEGKILPDLRVGVLIVGGGLTGLTAAHELQRMQKHGIPLPAPPSALSLLTTAVDCAEGGKPSCIHDEQCIQEMPFVVVEAGSGVGGCLETQRSACGAFLWDSGANSFRLTTETRQLVKEVGLDEELLTAPREAPRFAAVGGQLLPLPHSLPSLISSSILSWRGKVHLAKGLLFGADSWVPPPLRTLKIPRQGQVQGDMRDSPKDLDSPTVSEYVRTVLGTEVERKVVGALVTGIYAADGASLSMRLALPGLKALLDRGLIRSLAATAVSRLASFLSPSDFPVSSVGASPASSEQASLRQDTAGGGGKRRGPSIANFRQGMHALTLRLANALPPKAVLLRSHVSSLFPLSDFRPQADGFLAVISTPNAERRILASHVLLTTPPNEAARLLGTAGASRIPQKQVLAGDGQLVQQGLLSSTAVRMLNALPLSSVALVTLALRPATNEKLQGLTPNGFGYLVSPAEASAGGWETMGAISVSRIFEGRAPKGFELYTAFLGGPSHPEAIEETDEQLTSRALRDLLRASKQSNLSFLPDPEAQESFQTREAYQVPGCIRSSVLKFPETRHSSTLHVVNEELLQQQRQRHPQSHLLLEGGWVSGIAVGDRVTAGLEAARVLTVGSEGTVMRALPQRQGKKGAWRVLRPEQDTFSLDALSAADQLQEPEELKCSKERHTRKVETLPGGGNSAYDGVPKEGPPQLGEEKEAPVNQPNKKKASNKQRVHKLSYQFFAPSCLQNEIAQRKERGTGLKRQEGGCIVAHGDMRREEEGRANTRYRNDGMHEPLKAPRPPIP
ncbi:hypothetical protein cyc_02741 [Cyclospora cayetanensis]|uniref:Amine oxidase domain-containing protein n=1 Tax=Cyclospora cayetanensis TaxID=88456 RepID=A0A1D3CU17_9EIME|nr:hypothetical protein cyc_02741 [Cyclospora cayetanensis]